MVNISLKAFTKPHKTKNQFLKKIMIPLEAPIEIALKNINLVYYIFRGQGSKLYIEIQ
jgi:hypothetical protein